MFFCFAADAKMTLYPVILGPIIGIHSSLTMLLSSFSKNLQVKKYRPKGAEKAEIFHTKTIVVIISRALLTH